MDKLNIHGLILSDLKIIKGDKGDVLHALKKTDFSFLAFGEAYFSTINSGEIKGWKKHTCMTLNLVVPVGEIRFIAYDDRPDSPTRGKLDEVKLSRKSYQRLTVPPGIWFAFQGMSSSENLLLNIADIVHEPNEAENLPLNSIAIPFHAW